MEKVIQDLTAIPGVVQSMIVNNDGEVILSAGSARFEPSTLSQISVDFIQLFGAYELSRNAIAEVDIHFDSGNVLIKAKESFLLIVLYQSTSALSMIRLTLNVAVAELDQNKKFQKLLKDSNSRWNLIRRDSLRVNERALWEIIRI